MAAGAGTASPASGPGVVRDPEASQSKKRPGREGGEGARRSDAMAGGGGSSDSSGRAAGRRASRSSGRARRGRQEPGLGGATERGAGEARLEEAVNRWVLKFYFHEALRAFRGSRYGDFRQIRDIMQGEGQTWERRLAGEGDLWGAGGIAEPTMSSFPALLVRPLGKEHTVSRLLRVMQCLSRIEEGENLGMAISVFFSGLIYGYVVFQLMSGTEGFGDKAHYCFDHSGLFPSRMSLFSGSGFLQLRFSWLFFYFLFSPTCFLLALTLLRFSELKAKFPPHSRMFFRV